MRKITFRRPMCVLSLLFVLIMYAALNLQGGVDLKEYDADFSAVTVEGRVVDKVYKNEKYSLHILSDLGRVNTKRFIAYLDGQSAYDYKIGQKVRISGKYQNFSLPENDGEFNSRKYYRIRGYEASIVKARVVATGKNYSLLKEWLFGIKERTKKVYCENMQESEAGTMSAMVLGDKSELDTDIRDVYQAAGISHVLSLSGLHIAAVGMCVFSFMMLCGIHLVISTVFSSLLMILYGIMTGLSTSTIRALVMFLLAVLAKCIGRTYDLLSGMCLASILIIFENPYYVYDSGFLLSVCSVVGIALLYPILIEITDFFKEEKGIIYEKFRQSICISLATSLSTLPVTFNTFYKVSRYSIFINIIVVPLMSLILGIGIFTMIVGNTLIKVGAIRGIVRLLLFAAEKIIDLYYMLGMGASKMRSNYFISGEGEVWQSIVYIIVLALVISYYERYLEVLRKDRNKRNKLRRIFSRRSALMLTIATLILTIRSKPEMSINALSVGQGACNVIYGKNIPTVMIDGGSSDVSDLYKYRIKPFLLSKGIETVDYVFVTHPDKDHISGIDEFIEDDFAEIRIRHLFMSVYEKDIFIKAQEKGIETHLFKAGDSINHKSLKIECLSPKNAVKEPIEDEELNDFSLVLRLDYNGEDSKYVALFTGDISAEKEQELLDDSTVLPELKNVDFMSVPHHGSRFSSSEEFIKNANARICTISAGKNNSYGHPHKETLERFEKCSKRTNIYRTDQNGQITVEVDGKKDVSVRVLKRR